MMVTMSTGSWNEPRKVQQLSAAESARFSEWQRATAGREVSIVLHCDDYLLLPVWVFSAVLEGAPGDAYFCGLWHDMATGTMHMRFRSASFPQRERVGDFVALSMVVRAEWDLEKKTVLVEWPERTD